MTGAPIPENLPLPALRQELRILEGAPTTLGEPTWTIFDPLRHRYFQIDRPALLVLRHWGLGTIADLKHRLAVAEPDLESGDVIDDLIGFLFANGLTEAPPGDTVSSLEEQAAAGKKALWKWAVHNYLFVRLPLVRPHRFLKATSWLAAPFYTRTWFGFVTLLTLAGLYLTSRQWDAFKTTFLHFFSLEGAMLYMAMLVLIKIVHELGHAYTATRYGCRVPTMGIALLVMFPVLYTDTTDAWRLTSRRQRLSIDAAGMVTEVMIAGIATFLWAFLPDGPWRSAAFIAATTSWTMSLAVNLSPFMRFDGYYFLSDALGVQNLQPRAFAYGRWYLREVLFGLGDPAPEPMSSGLRRTLIWYAYGTWIYRFFLFLGIAFLVYALFFKALGVALFIIEIAWFIAIPILSELKVWWQMRHDIVRTKRTFATLAVLGLLATAAVIPWRSSVYAPGVLMASAQERVFPPVSAKLVQIAALNGDTVIEGQPMFHLVSDDLAHQISQAEERIALLNLRLDRRVSDDEDRAATLPLQGELIAQTELLTGLHEQAAKLTVSAPIAGRVTDIDRTLLPGRWIAADAPLALIINDRAHDIVGFVEETHLDRLRPGDAGVFVPDDPALPRLKITLKTIAASATGIIDIPYLSSTYGGGIAVSSEKGSELRPTNSQIRVTAVQATGATPPALTAKAIRGQIIFEGKAESLATRTWRQAVRIAIRESGF